MVLAPNQLIHIGPDPTGVSWNHYNLGLGLTSHTDYAQSALGSSPPVGQPWFYSRTNPTSGKDVVVFSAPLGGATTSTNTQYSRCELRELRQDGTTKADWDPKSGDHWIEGIYRIYGLSGLTKPGVCVSQAHDASDDTIQVRTELVSGATKLQMRFNGNLVGTLNASYVDGTEFYLKIRVNAGTPEIYYTTNLASIPSTPTYTSAGYFSGASTGWYWKTGCYNQTNDSTDPNVDPDASIIKVEIRELKTWHTGWATPALYTGSGGSTPVVSAGADATIAPSGTFTRTALVTLNGATLTSQSWKIISGPSGVGDVLSSTATVSWTPNPVVTTGLQSTTFRTMVKLTQAQYDALPARDFRTLYWVTPSGGSASTLDDVASDSFDRVEAITQSAYDALSTKDSRTMYVICVSPPSPTTLAPVQSATIDTLTSLTQNAYNVLSPKNDRTTYVTVG
jgi:hypothetical protein